MIAYSFLKIKHFFLFWGKITAKIMSWKNSHDKRMDVILHKKNIAEN